MDGEFFVTLNDAHIENVESFFPFFFSPPVGALLPPNFQHLLGVIKGTNHGNSFKMVNSADTAIVS